MTRSKSVTLAAILQFLLSAFLLVGTLPNLTHGATPEGGGVTGFVVTLLGFTASVLGIVAAYSAWRNTKNGKILALVVNVIFGFLFLGGVLFASPPATIIAGALLLVPILSIILLLWRTPGPVQA
jgi:hypothetical protein